METDLHRDPHARLNEAVNLSGALGLYVCDAVAVGVTKIRPPTLFGRGQVDELHELIEEHDVTLVVVDGQLSPVQQRNLEKAWHVKVIDRTGLILEIFADRARTREGRLQVELALLNYQRSRLVRSWTHLERQRGGRGFLAGPGESQIEIDRRLISERIAKLKRELDSVRRTRALHRRARKRVPYPVVALVGYTNAGKSTLFNRLCNANVYAQDQLFATLDPTMRSVTLPRGRKIILSDTVGFISDLPHDLVAAFRATLEEVLEADVVVHVRDGACQDSMAQKEDVEQVLIDLGLEQAVQSGLLEALNKRDLLEAEERETLETIASRRANLVALSAVTGEGCEDLLMAIEDRLADAMEVVNVEIPYADGQAQSWFYQHGEVLKRDDLEDVVQFTVRLDPTNLGRYEKLKTDHQLRELNGSLP